MSLSPTQRTLDFLAERGYLADIAERRVTRKVTKDLFGFIDVVAVDWQRGCLGVQTTTGPNLAARAKKIKNECRDAALRWLRAGNRIELHGWRKLAKDGWVPRVVEVTLEDLG